VHQTGLTQDAKMPADRRVTDLELIGQVTRSDFSVSEQLKDAAADRISNRSQCVHPDI